MVRHNISVEVCRVENWDYKPKKKGGTKDSSKAIEEEVEVDDDVDYEGMDEDAPPQREVSAARSQPSHKRRLEDVES